MSNNLGGDNVAPGSANPEVAVNDRFGRIDAAMTETLAVDLSAGNVALTLGQLQSAVFLSLNGAAQARTVALVPCKRILFVKNRGTAEVIIGLGATNIVVGAGASGVLRTDGSADGLETVTAGGSGGGSGGGVPEAPEDGKLYGRKDKAWAEVPAPGGGGSAGAPRLYAPPLASKFNSSFVVAGTVATLTDHPSLGLLVDAPQSSAGRLSGKFVDVPATGDWSVTIGILPNLLCYALGGSGTSQPGDGAGLLLNGVGGHVQFFGVERNTDRLAPILLMKRYNGDGGAFTSTLLGPLFVSDDICYLRVNYSAAASAGTYQYSRNGAQFVNLGSYANNDHGDARKISRVGPGFEQANNGARPYQMSVPYWAQSWT